MRARQVPVAGARAGRVLAGLAGAVALGAALLTTSAAAGTTADTGTAGPVAYHHQPTSGRPSVRDIARMRTATDRFHNLATAEDAGYGLLHDQAGLSCIDMPGAGGMGVHWVNGALVGDPALDIRKPEALVYALDRDGTLRLAALEFIVDKAAWDSTHAQPPKLFPRAPFDVTAAPNRYGLPAFYSQHVWVWKPNPAGMLAMGNPRVTCPT